MHAGGLWRSTLTLLAGGALAQALPLLLGPWLTRLYSPTEFGQFALLWALATNVAVVGCARYEFALPLEREEGPAALLMGLCLRVLLGVTAASAVAGVVLLAWQDYDLALGLPLAVLAGAAAQWLTLWATRAQRYAQLAVARVLQYGGGAVAQLALGLAGLGAWGLLLGASLAGLGAAALLARPAPQGGWLGLLAQPRAALQTLARKHRDFPLLNTPHAFAGALQDSLALLIITSLAGDAAAGYWALALRYLKAPAGLVGGALSQTLYPRLVNARDPAEALALVRQALAALAVLALPLLLVLLLWGGPLFAWAFGERWVDAGHLAQALAPYIALHFIASPLSVATMAWQAQGWALRLALVGQLLFVAGLALGLKLGGLIGAAWGVSAAMALYFGFFFWSLATWKRFPAFTKATATTTAQGPADESLA
ncbi:oligosaccharide flippase family protein [Kinneretia asaccharophila]|uniref:O-antigen/teichoic acid export membrane protein n=1 Tax=Roseateles asaccharophilus TaxID=582607 RepID=A0A4R6MYE7_9BURK|nr:oligosaccharide flippase family protein [Roseateles asaccharophilus]MDN3545743.1 oligosaccharide flippase family protein [Roseateles asaccharophilus]TDP07611.1 O-antigen/teichoic acid export membrane protein [Roseateles asaccharophilus]